MAERDPSPTSVDSVLSHITVQNEEEHAGERSSLSASPPTSTPPTSLGDEASILDDATKIELVAETHEETLTPDAPADAAASPEESTPTAPNSEGRRSSRNARKSVTTYNVQILAGTAIHTPTKYLEKHHKNVLHGPLAKPVLTSPASTPKKRTLRRKSEPTDLTDPAEEQLASEAAQAAQRRTSSRVGDLRKHIFRNLAASAEGPANKAARGKNALASSLRRSASDSRLRQTASSAAAASPRRPRTARAADPDTDEDDEEEEEDEIVKPKTKEWMRQGLYVGQDRDFDARLSESQNRQKRKSRKVRENKVLPLPMFAGERLLNGDPRTNYRDFKLPYDTYHPLPRKIKPDGWVKLHKNRFIGDASTLWKREKQDSSQCYCDPEDGCGEACHNRIMAYECDATNCRLTPEECGNRPFAQLKRRAKGNGYDYGVEVLETDDRGFGVRAMRSFEPHQIIVEYAGEIITQQECERRMKQVYKKDKCYYLMSFDNKMIIDATRGTIARFVNHSCEPNCEMIKWTVGGEPRMALFAGSRGIMTGEELTYDYNFDPFSQKNIQECRCGTKSCRGVLGPKPKKPLHEEKSVMSSVFSGAKRKLQEVFGSRKASESAPNSPKKRKLGLDNSVSTKVQNAMARKSAEREKAAKNAAEHAAQIASRKDRALKRSRSMTVTTRRSTMYRVAPRASMPNLKSARQTAVTVKRRTLTKPSSLKSVNKPGRLPSIARRTAAAFKGKKGLPPPKVPKTPVRDSEQESEESEEDDNSPNITPASLRSANKKFMQTKLPFKPLKSSSSSSPGADSLGFPESDQEDQEDLGHTYATSNIRGKKRGSAPAPRGLHKTGAGVVKRRGAGRVRDDSGRFV